MIDLAAIREQMEAKPTEELVDILARRNEEEWRPEVFDIVSEVLRGRRIAIDEAVAAARTALALEPVPDPEARVDLVTVGRFLTPVEAQLCHAHLARGGLTPVIADENMTALGLVLVTGGVRVQVPVEQEAEALELIRQGQALEFTERCPSCGSSDIVHAEVGTPQATCGKCGHRW
jgi:hypothetical protein